MTTHDPEGEAERHFESITTPKTIEQYAADLKAWLVERELKLTFEYEEVELQDHEYNTVPFYNEIGFGCDK